MPKCFTCQEEITFDKNIRSKTGKQIPLTPDKRYAHSHDQEGNPLNQPLPNQQQQQQYSKDELGSTFTPTDIPKSSAGGSYLDQKRLRVMVEDLTKEVREIKEILNSRTIIDTNKNEGRWNQMYEEFFKPFFSTQGKIASDLMKEKGKQQNIDTTMINHSKKADQNLATKTNTKFVDESKEDMNNLDERIPDNHDEMLGSQYDDNDNTMKGVIDEE